MKLTNNLLYFDIYSKTASFYYNNQEKIGSKFGLFLTILYVLTSLTIITYYLIIAFQRSEIKEYDSSIYEQEVTKININSNNLYFAFGLEDPVTSNRYIDETIYYPQILFIDRIKINGEFHTIEKKELEYDRCKEEGFGQNYQHFLTKGELNNSYCLKNFDFNLTFAGGYKYEKMAYIRIKIFPCKNHTKNNNYCKPQEVIDSYLTSGYFSILIKDFSLNPLNYSNPVIPNLQNLFTTIDRRLYKNFIIDFGITEINTDIGFFNENIHKEKYLKYRESFDYFFFREEQGINVGNEICNIQLKLDDTITIHTRKYTKISEIFPKIGGYMNLIYIIFSFFSILINQFNLELKIINGIFDFNLKENKMVFKLSSFDFNSFKVTNVNKSVIITSQKNLENFKFDFNKYKSKHKNDNSNSFGSNNLDDSDSKKITDIQNNNKTKTLNKNMKSNSKKFITRKSNENYPKFNLFINDKEDKKNVLDYKDNININLFDYFCRRKNKNIKQSIQLYNLGIGFYRKLMDVIHVFVLLLITEKVLFNNYKQQIYYFLKDNKFLFTK